MAGGGISFLQGLGSNFADEIAGAGAAAGIPPHDRRRRTRRQAYSDTRATRCGARKSAMPTGTRRKPFFSTWVAGLWDRLAATPRSVISGTGRLGARTVRAGLRASPTEAWPEWGRRDDVSGRLSSGALGATGGLLLGVGTENIGSARSLRAVGSMRSSGPFIDPATGQITRTGFKAIQRVG